MHWNIFENILRMTINDALDKQYWISQSGESHDSVTHLVNKYVTCTHNAQIRQVSIWKNASGRWQWLLGLCLATPTTGSYLR